jgi:hypothetical protein
MGAAVETAVHFTVEEPAMPCLPDTQELDLLAAGAWIV